MMKKFKKLGATLFLIAVATVGVSITAQTARANCLAPLKMIDADGNESYAFISCGSSAGNYIGYTDGSSDTSSAVDFLCDSGMAC